MCADGEGFLVYRNVHHTFRCRTTHSDATLEALVTGEHTGVTPAAFGKLQGKLMSQTEFKSRLCHLDSVTFDKLPNCSLSLSSSMN